MKFFWKAASFAAGIAVATSAAAGADQPRRPASLTSFGAPLSAYQFSAGGFLALNAPPSVSHSDFAPVWFAMPSGGLAPRDSFAASIALSSALALDAGVNVDIAQRFDNFDDLKSPLLDSGSMLSLANGGAYAGLTWMPTDSLHLRLGADLRSDRLDTFSFSPIYSNLNLPYALNDSQSRALLAGIAWDMNGWSRIGVNAIHNDQYGAPFAVENLGNLSGASRVDSNALEVAARVKLGDNWVTTASVNLAGSLSQLDQRSDPTAQREPQTYTITVAKHGLFGDDALGFSFSQPVPGLLTNGFDMSAASGNMPPQFAASGNLASQSPETDLQLGYVTTFGGGEVALQANASFQMNYQGQPGATSLSVLSRAKIKF